MSRWIVVLGPALLSALLALFPTQAAAGQLGRLGPGDMDWHGTTKAERQRICESRGYQYETGKTGWSCTKKRKAAQARTSSYDIETSFPAPEPSWDAAASALSSTLVNMFSGPSVPSYSAPRRSTSYNSGPSAAELARQRAEVLRWEAEQERKRGEVDALRERLEALRSGSGTPSYRESASPSVDTAQWSLEAARENLNVASLRAKVARLKARAEEIASEPIVQMGSAYLPVALATSVAAITGSPVVAAVALGVGLGITLKAVRNVNMNGIADLRKGISDYVGGK